MASSFVRHGKLIAKQANRTKVQSDAPGTTWSQGALLAQHYISITYSLPLDRLTQVIAPPHRKHQHWSPCSALVTAPPIGRRVKN
jgi:hypothetical protein